VLALLEMRADTEIQSRLGWDENTQREPVDESKSLKSF